MRAFDAMELSILHPTPHSLHLYSCSFCPTLPIFFVRVTKPHTSTNSKTCQIPFWLKASCHLSFSGWQRYHTASRSLLLQNLLLPCYSLQSCHSILLGEPEGQKNPFSKILLWAQVLLQQGCLGILPPVLLTPLSSLILIPSVQPPGSRSLYCMPCPNPSGTCFSFC